MIRSGEGLELVERGQSVLDGKLDQAGQVMHVQLVHDLAAIGIHRFGRQPQPIGDLGRRLPVGQPPHDLTLTLVQPIERRLAAALMLAHVVIQRGMNAFTMIGRFAGGDL